MSHYSGFSSASRMEIERLNEEKANFAIKTAAEMAEKDRKLEALQAMLVANGLVGVDLEPIPGTSTQALGTTNETIATITPSRKRHSSQQLERSSKWVGGANRFEVLTQDASYPDKTMKPGSMVSTTGIAVPETTYASRLAGFRPHKFTLEENVTVDQPGVERFLNHAHMQANKVTTQGSGKNHILVEGLFDVQNNGGMRQEIEIALESLNGEPFRGTITPLEAKYGIYSKCLGFPDFDNFEGFRFGHKGVPVITLILKSAINVDELLPIQYFEYLRKSSRQGRSHTDVISCKIRGLRANPGPGANVNRNDQGTTNTQQDDGTRTVSIEGCEYRVPKEALVSFLSCYGVITSDFLEVVYKDGDTQDNIRMGSYSVKVRLNRDLPQLAPIMGKRVKFYYKGIQKLCPKCFGSHHIKNCHSKKIQWLTYVENFMERENQIPDECFGRWKEIISNTKNPGTGNKLHLLTQSNRPTSQSELNNGGRDDLGVANTLPTSPLQSQVSDTATWIRNLPHSVTRPLPLAKKVVEHNEERPELNIHQESGQQSTTNKYKPEEKDFNLPASAGELKLMVDKLVKAGSSQSEAEQIIANRKTAFNKASREFKRSQSVKIAKQSQKRATKTSKTASLNKPEYDA